MGQKETKREREREQFVFSAKGNYLGTPAWFRLNWWSFLIRNVTRSVWKGQLTQTSTYIQRCMTIMEERKGLHGLVHITKVITWHCIRSAPAAAIVTIATRNEVRSSACYNNYILGGTWGSCPVYIIILCMQENILSKWYIAWLAKINIEQLYNFHYRSLGGNYWVWCVFSIR